MQIIIICILVAAVALLAFLSCYLRYMIGSKDDRLRKLADENQELRETIHEMENDLQREFEIIRAVHGNQGALIRQRAPRTADSRPHSPHREGGLPARKNSRFRKKRRLGKHGHIRVVRQKK